MNSKILKRTASVLTILCVLCVTLISTVMAAPEQPVGSITLLGEPQYEGIPFTLVEIADTSSGFKYVPEFADVEIDLTQEMTASERMEAAEYLRDYALLTDVEGETETIESNGNLAFTGLSLNKVYLLFQSDGFDTVDSSPVITTVPYKDPDGNFNDNVFVDVKQSNPAGSTGSCNAIITKVDDDNNPLQGAIFKLYIKKYDVAPEDVTDEDILDQDENGDFVWKYVETTDPSNENGQIAIIKKAFGEYRLIEIEAPEGYQLDETPHDFKLKERSLIKFENGLWVPEIGEPESVPVENIPESSVIDDSVPEDSPSEPDRSRPHPSEYSEELSEPSEHSQTSHVEDHTPSLTGDDIAKYIIIGGIVVVSLVVIILLVVLGGKKKDDNDK